MAVLNTTSPTVVPVAPIELPIRAVRLQRQDGGRERPLDQQKHWVLRMVTVARRLLATRRASANGCSQMGYCFGCGRGDAVEKADYTAHL